MPNMIVNDIIEVRVLAYTQQQIAVNVLHYKVTAANGTAQTTLNAAARFVTLTSLPYKNAMSATARYRGCGARRIWPLPRSIEDFDTTADGVGAVAGDMLPKQISGILTKRTAFAGPQGQGRVYIPFPSEADNDSDATPVVSYGTRLGVIGSALFVPITVGTAPNDTILTPILWDRFLHVDRTIAGHIVRDRWATQRRRGDYGRTNLLPW